MSAADPPDTLSPDDAKLLIRLCRAGRLYEIEEWIQAGKPLLVPKEIKTTPLDVALETRFHSLIDLLLRHEGNQQTKNRVLERALWEGRRDVADLALEHGAETASASFLDVLLSWDRQLASFFLDKGADPIAGMPFAHAFHQRVRTALGVYLDCKRSRPELTAQLQHQADIALRQFCQEGNLKWVSLLMWLGADPRSRGPTLDDLDDPDAETTALEEACTNAGLDVLKRLKPDPHQDDLGNLLRVAGSHARTHVVTYLLDLGADPNDKPDGSSTALDGCLRYIGWEHFYAVRYGREYRTPAYKVANSRQAIRALAEPSAPPGLLMAEGRAAITDRDGAALQSLT